jgi:hypothetical protein
LTAAIAHTLHTFSCACFASVFVCMLPQHWQPVIECALFCRRQECADAAHWH